MLSRSAIDFTRIAQAVLVLVATLVPDLADLQDEADAAVIAVSLLVTAYLEARKRSSVTPLDSPRTDNGTPLVPTRAGTFTQPGEFA